MDFEAFQNGAIFGLETANFVLHGVHFLGETADDANGISNTFAQIADLCREIANLGWLVLHGQEDGFCQCF